MTATESSDLLDAAPPTGEEAPVVSADEVFDLDEQEDLDARFEGLYLPVLAPNAELDQSTRTAPFERGDSAPSTSSPEAFDEIPAAATRPRNLRQRYYRRRFGVAPYVRPASRRTRRQRRRDYRKLGFIELTQEKTKRRHRILPRSVIGISVTAAAMGLGAAFSGAALYAYYDYRLSQNKVQLDRFVTGFQGEYDNAAKQLTILRDDATKQVNGSLGPLQRYVDEANAVVTLPQKVGAGVWLVRTSDADGRPAVGSAFVVASDDASTMLLTSYQLVTASAAKPGPQITLEKGGESLPGVLWNWDPDRDLALVTIEKGGEAPLPWADAGVAAKAVGGRAYAMGAIGGAGATASPGQVIDQSNVGLQHTAAVGAAYRGGPIVNADGQVLGVASLAYRPLGFDPGEIRFAPPASAACEHLLICTEAMWQAGGPSAQASAAGAAPAEAPPAKPATSKGSSTAKSPPAPAPEPEAEPTD
ncbi:MAG: serine protease [Acidimicrobiales bacterium]